jgi:hypothetical protein
MEDLRAMPEESKQEDQKMEEEKKEQPQVPRVGEFFFNPPPDAEQRAHEELKEMRQRSKSPAKIQGDKNK